MLLCGRRARPAGGKAPGPSSKPTILKKTLPGLFLLIASACGSATGEGRSSDFADRLVAAALERTNRPVRYNGSYREIAYPGGDVPDDVGVCTDLVIRSYRAVGIDLQKEVHEDMSGHFGEYPREWALPRPDPNIDHRRVLNLRTFFRRNGRELPVTSEPGDFPAGDLVTWRLPSGRPHIGIVTSRRSGDGRRPLIVHNIGKGPEVDDVLFKFPITGHYRYPGTNL